MSGKTVSVLILTVNSSSHCVLLSLWAAVSKVASEWFKLCLLCCWGTMLFGWSQHLLLGGILPIPVTDFRSVGRTQNCTAGCEDLLVFLTRSMRVAGIQETFFFGEDRWRESWLLCQIFFSCLELGGRQWKRLFLNLVCLILLNAALSDLTD